MTNLSLYQPTLCMLVFFLWWAMSLTWQMSTLFHRLCKATFRQESFTDLEYIWANYVKAECLCQLRYPSSSFCNQIIQFYMVSALATLGFELTEWNSGIFLFLSSHIKTLVSWECTIKSKKIHLRTVLRWIPPLRCASVC